MIREIIILQIMTLTGIFRIVLILKNKQELKSETKKQKP